MDSELYSRVARHGAEIRAANRRVDEHEEELKGVRTELKELRESLTTRFDRNTWLLVATLGGIIAELITRHL